MDETHRKLEEVSSKNIETHMKIKSDAYKAMNNIIFVISTGAFVVVISLIGYLKTYIYHPWILLVSIISLSLTITLNFIAHWITAKSSIRLIGLLNKERSDGFPGGGGFSEIFKNDNDIKYYKKFAGWVNVSVLIFLILGVAALICFGYLNLILNNTPKYSF